MITLKRSGSISRRTVLMASSLLVLSGCGWHLRGKQTIPLDTIYINLGINSAVRATLKRNLEAQTNVKIVDTPEEADATLHWFNAGRSSSILAVNSKGRARIYDLRATVTFRLNSKDGAVLVPNTVLSASREMTWDEEDYNARESESQMLYQDMENSLIHQAVTRLSHLTPEMVQKRERDLE